MTSFALTADILVAALLDAPDWAERVIGRAEIDALSAAAALERMAARSARIDLGPEILAQLGVPVRAVSFELLIAAGRISPAGSPLDLADRTAVAFAKANGLVLATSADALTAAAHEAGVESRHLAGG